MKRASEDEINPSPQKFGKTEDKYGSSGTIVPIKANYFDLERNLNFTLGQYRLDFDPDTEVVNTRKDIVRENQQVLGLTRYTFDGSSLYTASDIKTGDYVGRFQGSEMKITVRKTGNIRADDKQAFQIFNLIFRDTMATLKLQNIRRNYFDPHAAIDVPEGNLQLWPGYLTSIRAYEGERTLLNTEVIHKFMRKETIYDIARRYMNDNRLREDWREILKREVIGTTVLTDYTNKTYLIDDVDFSKTPLSTFRSSNGEETTYANYYQTKYRIQIKDVNQFLLVSRARERDIRAGHPELIYLIPELSRATGLTDSMRANFRLMQNISAFTRLSPTDRAASLYRFNNRLRQTPEAIQVLNQWNVELGQELVEVKARELRPETIVFGGGRMETPNARAEWNIRDGVQMYSAVDCLRWVFFYPREMERESLTFLTALREAGSKMSYNISDPLHRAIYDDRQETYIKEIDSIAGKKPRLIVIALPTNRADRYSSVKRRCMVDLGIPCQVVVKNKTMTHRNLHSIATKVAIQINCKLGGIPWMIKLPIKGLMTVGFDVSHHPRDRARSIGALVSTMDLTATAPIFFSITMEYHDGNEMVEGLDRYLKAALDKFATVHQALPERIVFYRDGVGEGQIDTVNAKEVQPILRTLGDVYKDKAPRFAYIIVNKHSNARFFKPTGSKTYMNPQPGTVIDNVVTMSDRNDFYLISQHVGQGTVSPTYYQIIHNSTQLNTDKLQILTYKMCHIYYNWGGTVRIPCVSQFAKKLAFLTSQSLMCTVHPALAETLYFL